MYVIAYMYNLIRTYTLCENLFFLTIFQSVVQFSVQLHVIHDM